LPPEYSLATAVKGTVEPSESLRVTVTSSPGFTGVVRSMIMMWFPPGSSSKEPLAGTVKPPSTGCIAI
jgi:hypothetical protein